MKRNNKGMALIMAVAIVGILAGIAATFAYNMRIDQKAAANYLYFIKAGYLAEAGIARAVAELKNDAQSSSWLVSHIDRLYNSDFGEVWADGSTISGPTNGVLGEGYFDLCYKRTIAGTGDVVYTQLDEISNKVNGHVINGIIDEERKININYANATLLNSLPKISGLGSAIVTDRTTYGNFNSIAELMRLTDLNEIDRNHLYGDDDGKGVGGGSAPKMNNHKLDSSYENDEGSDNILDGGIEDLITVYTDSISDAGNITSPVNVNTAPETVLKAVIGGITGFSPPPAVDADRDAVVKAILDYRSGAIGDNNPNPFDGIDQNRNDASDLDPDVSGFTSDNLDNDGDETTDEADEAYMFAGGARGEFNALLDHLITSGYNGVNTISSVDAANIMDNADPAANVDYSGDGNPDNIVWTTSFIFDSKYFQIISTGVVERGGVKLAEQKLMQIIGPIE